MAAVIKHARAGWELIMEATEWKGEHFWSLVGRLAVVMGLPIAIPIVGGFFWLGQVSARIDGQEHQVSNLLTVVSGLVTLDAGQSETIKHNEDEIRRLRDAVDTLRKAWK